MAIQYSVQHELRTKYTNVSLGEKEDKKVKEIVTVNSRNTEIQLETLHITVPSSYGSEVTHRTASSDNEKNDEVLATSRNSGF